MSLSGATLAALENIANRYIEMSPDAGDRIARLHGRVFSFELLGLGLKLTMIPGPDGIQLYEHIEGEPDCTLRGTPLALLSMGDSKESSARLFAGEVEISGDTELAHRLGNILGSMDIDWEEQLSRYTGDILAHQLGNQFRGTLRWGQRALQTMGMDLTEFLQEELELLPSAPEIDDFLTRVDEMRDGVERLEARYNLLSRARADRVRRGEGEEA